MLELDQLTASPGGNAVLKGLSLKVRPGEKLLLRGASGSGKSTLLRAILFFESFTGSLRFAGAPVGPEAVPGYRSRFAFLGQRIPPYAGSAGQVLFLPFSYRANSGRRPDRREALELLARFRLEEALLEQPFESLSGGQKQRLLLAQVLLLGRPFLLLDEPTTGLDPANRKRIIRHLCGLDGVTLLAVSHDPEWAVSADRCLELSGGRLRPGRCAR